MTVLSQLEQKIRYGSLLLNFRDGAIHRFGHGSPKAEWVVRAPRTLSNIARDPEVRLGEAYVNGEWDAGECGLLPLLEVLLRNYPLQRLHGWQRLLQVMRQWQRQWNRLTESKQNVAHHYGREEEFFRYFLDPDLHYSCAYFEEPKISLEQAQSAKCRYIMNKLLPEPGQQVLDIGCGWGDWVVISPSMPVSM